jgi:hypothetical protein
MTDAALKELDQHLVDAMRFAAEKVDVPEAARADLGLSDWLRGFWVMYNQLDTSGLARAMFPDQTPDDALSVLDMLAHYAYNRSEQMDTQARGNHLLAAAHLLRCESIHRGLPDWALNWYVPPMVQEEAEEFTDPFDPDFDRACSNCGASPIVPATGLCGPCTFGEGKTWGGNW